MHVQLGCIAHGLQPNLSINHTPEVWRCLRSSLRTMNPVMPPSDLIVAFAPRSTLPGFLSVPALAADLTKIMAKHRPHDPSYEIDQMVMAACLRWARFSRLDPQGRKVLARLIG